jgi:hypothetical protein
MFVSALLVTTVLGIAGCNDITNQPLPAGTFDPATVNTREGARALAVTAHAQFQFALAEFIPISGLITDELQSNRRGTPLANNAFPDGYTATDARYLPERVAGSFSGFPSDHLYATLQQARALANQAIGALAKYDPDSSAVTRGELYAREAYAEVMLADLFCSGVPLSTSDFQRDFTYRPSSSTEQVYQHAITLFDSALVLAGDTGTVANFAKVGKARALIAVGQYMDAKQAVEGVPVDYVYTERIQTCTSVAAACYIGSVKQASFSLAFMGSESDREGTVGLPFRSSFDPRSAPRPSTVGTVNGNAVYFPAKFNLGDVSALVVASGIEAELIRAEAALNSGGAWLEILNTLRTSGAYTGIDTIMTIAGTPPDTTFRYDTAWVAGTGGVGHLGPLQDPGNDAARVDLLFRERAFWLFLTGTRQGDLRRLIHNYGRLKGNIYPHGTYPSLGSYGDFADVPIPTSGNYSESLNPYYKGCLSRD